MAEHERLEKNKELKIKKPDYTGYDDDEFTPGQAGMKRAVLSKYDEFLEGSKETVRSYFFSSQPPLTTHNAQGFRLGSSSSAVAKAASTAVTKGNTEIVKKSLLSIDYESECSP